MCTDLNVQAAARQDENAAARVQPQPSTQLSPSPSPSLINARDLHAQLGVRWKFSDWWRPQVEKHGLIEGTDYIELGNFPENRKDTPGPMPSEYGLTHKAAAAVAAGHNSAQGRRMLRRILDEFERAKAPTPPPAIVEQAATHSELQSVGDRLAGVEDAVRAVAAAVKCVAAFGPIADHTGAYSVAEAAKLLGIGEIGLFAYLRQERMLLSDNTPAQRLIDNKHFRVHPQPWAKPNGERRIHLKPMVTPKGLAMLQQRFDGKQEASK